MTTLETVTLAEVKALAPPGPLHTNEKVVVALKATVICEPVLLSAPLQPFEAEQAVALVDAQLNVAVCPGASTEGLTVSDAVGSILTTVLACVVPLGPVQDNEYVLDCDSAPVLSEPLTASVPLQASDAVHVVASAEDHVSVVVPPAGTTLGLAVICTVGVTLLTTTVMLAGALLPPGPVQATEKLPLPVSAPVLWVPLAASMPLQFPDAWHAVALVDDQLNWLAAPKSTLAGAAVNAAVGAGVEDTGAPPPPQAANDAKDANNPRRNSSLNTSPLTFVRYCTQPTLS